MVDSVLERLRRDEEWLTLLERSREVALGGTRRVVDAGQGRGVLFVPMLGELNVLYVPQMRALMAKGYRVITYVPTVRTRELLTVEERVIELASVLDAVGLETCDLVAWSDTAAVAHRFALRQRRRVRTLTFVVVPDRYHLPLPLRALLLPLRTLPIERVVPVEVIRWVLGRYMGGNQIEPQVVRTFAQRIPELAAVFKWSCLPCIDEHDAARGCEVPALVMIGDASKVVAIRQAEALRLALGSDEGLVVIEGGEHLATYANADDVTAALLGFLARTGACTRG